MNSQEFCLKWDMHHRTLISIFEELLVNETFVDVTLVAEGKSIRVHKVVLAACSAYFYDIVHLHQNHSLAIFLKDVKYSELQVLVDYMYRGEIQVAQGSLPSLIQTAQYLKIRGLAKTEEIESKNQPIESDLLPHGKKRSGTSARYCQKKKKVIQSSTHEPSIQLDTEVDSLRTLPVPVIENSELDSCTAPSSSSCESDLKMNYMGLPTMFEECGSSMQSLGPRKLEDSGEDRDHRQEGLSESDGTVLGYELQGSCDITTFPSYSSISGGYSCASCNKTYKHRRNLRRHENYECPNARKFFSCPLCSETFKRKCGLEAHLLKVHSST
ncbi:longitudinals lacking protein, isoforms F/I/K/T-like isoform X2 [Artemia franciscana]|uniref:longitudinals lacking protein, isoforms F/I/K/T-like isoform X2 n=1 Tax=Artemia franciscana TaxID=6661 RepID=UPI0032DB15D4